MKTNEELRQDVMEEIRWDPLLKDVASEIGVTAKEGVVTLSGEVDIYNKKLAAEQAAQRVAGVKVVAVDLQVRLDKLGIRTDIQIAEAIKNALTWHSAVNEDLIEIKVDNGWVFLDGKVEWEYEKKAVENALKDLIGIRGITNRITVKTKEIESKEIKRRITAAFHRSATVDSSTVNVEVSGNRAILTGFVRTWAERKDAENAAWSSPGITIVDNQIAVNTEIAVHS